MTYTHAGDLWHLVDHLGLESVVLVGLSMGGQIVLEATLGAPRRTRALVLLDAFLDGVPWDVESRRGMKAIPEGLRSGGIRGRKPPGCDTVSSSRLGGSRRWPNGLGRWSMTIQGFTGRKLIFMVHVPTVWPSFRRSESDQGVGGAGRPCSSMADCARRLDPRGFQVVPSSRAAGWCNISEEALWTCASPSGPSALRTPDLFRRRRTPGGAAGGGKTGERSCRPTRVAVGRSCRREARPW